MALMDLCHPRNIEWARVASTSAILGACNQAARVAFAVSYLLVRALYFPYVILSGVVPDLLALLRMAAPPVSKASLGVVLVAAIALLVLQLHWARLLLVQALGGKGAASKKS